MLLRNRAAVFLGRVVGILPNLAVVATIALFATAALLSLASTACAGESLAVTVRSGRTFRGELDSRSSVERLWIRYGSAEQSITRGVEWAHVENAEWNGRQFSGDELKRTLAPRLRKSESTSELPKSAPDSQTESKTRGEARTEMNLAPDPSTLAQRRVTLEAIAPRSTPQARGVSLDARLANWDAGAALDGLLLDVVVFDAKGRAIEARGTIEVSVFTTGRADYPTGHRSQGYAIRKVAQQTLTLDAESRVGAGHHVLVPLHGLLAKPTADYGVYGLVHVRVTIPGHGVFEAVRDGVRLQVFSPVEDHFRRQPGTGRFPR